MSLVTLSHMCSHLQNASRARLGLTSLPSTKHTLALALALQQSGFLSTVIRGGPEPPPLLTPTSMPHADATNAYSAESEVTQENIASRRLWVGLKYLNTSPVLSELKMESKPKKRVTLGVQDIAAVIRGGHRKYVKGMTRVGECLYLLTDRGLMEARECEERGTGGLVICRVV